MWWNIAAVATSLVSLAFVSGTLGKWFVLAAGLCGLHGLLKQIRQTERELAVAERITVDQVMRAMGYR